MKRRIAASSAHPSDKPTVEDLIFRAVQDERRHGPSGLSFAPVYSFVSAVAHMARGQERQAILDALPTAREQGKSAEWNEGYDAAVTTAIRILVQRSYTE
jgi:hypothetical protein